MDSSPDLSLKLRRGSSDSRDNFYMDFAQGIDSDIEEVDNSGIAREPQQPPTPSPPTGTAPATSSNLDNIIPPPMSHMNQQVLNMSQPLPTLNEQDDLPPTPPPMSHQSSTAMSSPPLSPTSSVLEMVPPPPLSPISPNMARSDLPPSPPLETEDEAENDTDEREDDDYDAEKLQTPPPLPPLPSNLSYVHGNGAHGHGLPHVPVTPPSESDQSQPNSPPPLPAHHHVRPISSPPLAAHSDSPGLSDYCPATPPTEFGGDTEMMAAALAAAVESASLDLVQEVMQGVSFQVGDESRSYNDDESTTITTPPSNGYSGSSILAPPPEHMDEMEEEINLANIPPPEGML